MMTNLSLPLRTLGDTNIRVSALGLGTVKFGRNEGVKYPEGFEIPPEDKLSDLLLLAKNLGINTLDTAPAYGQSEERLGRLLTGQRGDWVIVGKAGEDFENGESSFNFSADHFERSLERSLTRLNTGYLDVLLVHSDGRDTDILSNDSLIKKLHIFKEQGLVKAIGASTKTAEGGLLALGLLDIAMVSYNPTYTDEKCVLDYAAQRGKGVLVKKALASGHIGLGGQEAVEDAMRFAFSQPAVSSIIIGTINPGHLRDNAAAAIRALS